MTTTLFGAENSEKVNEQLQSLAEGYARLNQLALDAPLGLVSAAAAHHARLSSFGLSTERTLRIADDWDKEKHRQVMWENREIKRSLDSRFVKLSSKKVPRYRRETREQLPGAKFSDSRRPVFERKKPVANTNGFIALKRYRGGYHFTRVETQREEEPPGPENEKTKSTSIRRKSTKRSVAAKGDHSEIIAVAKESMREAAASVKRAADAAERAARAAVATAADRSSRDSQQRSTTSSSTVVVLEDPAPEYRTMVPRNAPPTAKKIAEKPHAVETRPFVPPSTAPRVRTIDRDLYLAEARDDPFDGLDEDAPRSLPPKRKQRAPCVEPGISRLEAERMMAVSKAEPVYIAEGKRKPARRQSKRSINPSKALNEVDQAPQRRDVLVDDEDCTRLVARILLDRS